MYGSCWTGLNSIWNCYHTHHVLAFKAKVVDIKKGVLCEKRKDFYVNGSKFIRTVNYCKRGKCKKVQWYVSCKSRFLDLHYLFKKDNKTSLDEIIPKRDSSFEFVISFQRITPVLFSNILFCQSTYKSLNLKSEFWGTALLKCFSQVGQKKYFVTYQTGKFISVLKSIRLYSSQFLLWVILGWVFQWTW